MEVTLPEILQDVISKCMILKENVKLSMFRSCGYHENQSRGQPSSHYE